MKYLVNRETKEHVVCRDEFCIRSDRWTLVEADSEGWLKHTGNVCPLPKDAPCLIRFKAGSETGRTVGKHWDWGLGSIAYYRPILTEKVQEPDYDPRSVSFNLLDRLKAAHEHAQQIPDLEAELREVLEGMGYGLVRRSPFTQQRHGAQGNNNEIQKKAGSD